MVHFIPSIHALHSFLLQYINSVTGLEVSFPRVSSGSPLFHLLVEGVRVFEPKDLLIYIEVSATHGRVKSLTIRRLVIPKLEAKQVNTGLECFEDQVFHLLADRFYLLPCLTKQCVPKGDEGRAIDQIKKILVPMLLLALV